MLQVRQWNATVFRLKLGAFDFSAPAHKRPQSFLDFPMGVPDWIATAFMRTADAATRWFPRRRPPGERLEECRIVSHRGDFDNRSIFENTLPAFDRIAAAGVWGIEFDVRWTRDLVPVVIHDADTRRVFQQEIVLDQISFADLKVSLPQIPTLEEMLQRYGKKLHLMVEIKKEVYPRPDYQNRVLEGLFSPLAPNTDYHLLSLNPEMFQFLDFVPSATFLPVAELNVRQLSELSAGENYGGLLGHYLLMSNRVLDLHHRRGQKTGTGFVESGNCLYRELNRGVEWIFSNSAAALQSLVDREVRNMDRAY